MSPDLDRVVRWLHAGGSCAVEPDPDGLGVIRLLSCEGAEMDRFRTTDREAWDAASAANSPLP